MSRVNKLLIFRPTLLHVLLSNPMALLVPARKAFASTDIEADGTNPCQHSMRGLGIVLLDINSREIGRIDLAIAKRDDRKEDPKTMTTFWAENKAAWERLQKGALQPREAMDIVATRYKLWLLSYDDIEWIAKPSAFDWMWFRCYYDEFAPPGSPAIPHKATCISSSFNTFCDMMRIFGPRKAFLEDALMQRDVASHLPAQDALEQGRLYTRLLRMIASPTLVEELWAGKAFLADRIQSYLEPDDYKDDADDDEPMLLEPQPLDVAPEATPVPAAAPPGAGAGTAMSANPPV